MDELDRFMREQYEQSPPRPATPPAGGWQTLARQLRDGQPVPPAPLRRRYAWWWVSGIIGLLLVGYVGYATAGSTELGAAFPVPTSLPDRSISLARVGDATTKLPKIDEDQLEPNIESSVSTPSGAVASPGVANMNSSAGAATPANVGTVVSVLAEPTVAVIDSFRVLMEATRAAATPSNYTLQDLLPTTQSSAQSTEYDATSWVMDEVAPNLHATDYGAGLRNRKWTFEEVPSSEQPPGVWEVTALVFPWVVRNDDRYLRVTTDTTGGNIYPEGTYTLNSGRPLTVYYDEAQLGRGGTLDQQRLALLFTTIEFARRTPSGFRFSLGASFGLGQQRSFDYSIEDLGSDFGPDDYALIYRSEDGSALFLTAGVQYTINRRKRFRIIAGINAVTSVYQSYRNEATLVGGSPYEEHFVRRVTSRDEDFLDFVVPTPQFTFQYQMSQHLSLTAGLGSTLGVGATYGW